MIDSQVFAEAMAVLSDRFNRPFHPGTQREYHAILSAELSTEDFTVAARIAFRESQFWPSPQQLIDFAKPPRDLELEAVEMFDRMRDLGEDNAGYGRNWRRDKIAELGEPTLAGFKAIGANEGLRNLEVKNLHWIRQSFIAAYKAKARETKADRLIEAARAALASPPRTRGALKSGPVPIGDVIIAHSMPPAATVATP